MSRIKSLLSALALSTAITGIAAVAPAFAGVEVNTTTGIVLADGKPAPGLAVKGYDVVAYQTEKKPVVGDADIAVVHGEATYRFTTKANADLFKANPAKYIPAYGGYCAYGVSVGAKFDADPNLWNVVDGRLYLNLDKNILAAFNKDIPGAVKKADANWPSLETKTPGK